MVMRNRNDGSGAHRRNNLPPHLQARFVQPRAHDAKPASDPPADATAEPAPLFSRGELIGDLSRLAAAFLLAVCGIILFLLVAVLFVHG